MTKIGLKKIEDSVYEETRYIRDKIKYLYTTTDKEPDVVEEEEEEGFGAMLHNMTEKEEAM
eukprot:9284213-Heterocapsa_arctica.AAC.1